MRTWIAVALAAALTGTAFAQKEKKDAGKAPALATEEAKVLYALGVALSNSITAFDLTPAESAFVAMGLQDGVAGRKLQVDMSAYGPKIQELDRARTAVRLEAQKKKNAVFLEAAAKEKNAVRAPSGVIYTEMKAGTGTSPTPADSVKAHYVGALTDGTVFDSSYKKGQPLEFNLTGGVIPCWTEVVQKLKPGGKARAVCPPETAYGDDGRPPRIPGGSILVFEIELVEVVAATRP
ncbi:MAG: FKBP-type peptidyl-prolyl cis-trans isomerase [Elusimicrobia bacterium]|nr:FKBP-type peptidyl-prolyl cis-trans isomerase [Elusimicrobiota bacterium]